MEKKGKLRKSRPYKKYALIIVVVILLCNPYSLIFGALGIGEISNWFTLNHFAQPFFEYPLPVSSTELSRETEIVFGGDMGGNHGCIFKATRVIESPLSEAELEDYFADARFPMPYGEPSYFYDDGLVRVHVSSAENYYHLTILGGGEYERRVFNFGCR